MRKIITWKKILIFLANTLSKFPKSFGDFNFIPETILLVFELHNSFLCNKPHISKPISSADFDIGN